MALWDHTSTPRLQSLQLDNHCLLPHTPATFQHPTNSGYCKEKAIDGTLRAVLVNIVTAGQVVMVGTIIAATVNVITLTDLRPSDIACRLAVWLIASGGAARLMYMTTFAISAYVLIRYGTRKMKIWVAVVVFVGMWIGVLLSNAAIFSSDVLAISFHDYNTCAAHGTGYKAFIYAIGYISIYGLLGFTVSVLSAIATVWFIRHNIHHIR